MATNCDADSFPASGATHGKLEQADEFLVEMRCSHAGGARATVTSREADEAHARSQTRQWVRDTMGPVQVEVRISRRQVTPWVRDGETYTLNSRELT